MASAAIAAAIPSLATLESMRLSQESPGRTLSRQAGSGEHRRASGVDCGGKQGANERANRAAIYATRRDLTMDEVRNPAFRRVISSIPKGKVATYGQVAAAAGYPGYHRAVARLLRIDPTDRLPWQRVVGAGGAIKLRFEAASEQRFRLRMEGVTFRGTKVNLKLHQHTFAGKH